MYNDGGFVMNAVNTLQPALGGNSLPPATPALRTNVTLVEKIKAVVIAIFMVIRDCFLKIGSWFVRKRVKLAPLTAQELPRQVTRIFDPNGRGEASEQNPFEALTRRATITLQEGTKSLKEKTAKGLNISLIANTVKDAVKDKIIFGYSYNKFIDLLKHYSQSNGQLLNIFDAKDRKYIKSDKVREWSRDTTKDFMPCFNLNDSAIIDVVLKRTYLKLYKNKLTDYFERFTETFKNLSEKAIDEMYESNTNIFLEKPLGLLSGDMVVKKTAKGFTYYEETVDQTVSLIKEFLQDLETPGSHVQDDEAYELTAGKLLELLQFITNKNEFSTPVELFELPEELTPLFEEGYAILEEINCDSLQEAITELMNSFEKYKPFVEQYINPLIEKVHSGVDITVFIKASLSKLFSQYANVSSLTRLLNESLLPRIENRLIRLLAGNAMASQKNVGKYATEFLKVINGDINLQNLSNQLRQTVHAEAKLSKALVTNADDFFAIVKPTLEEIKKLIEDNTQSTANKQVKTIELIQRYFLGAESQHVNPDLGVIADEFIRLAEVEFKANGFSAALAKWYVSSDKCTVYLSKLLSDSISPYRTSPNIFIDAVAEAYENKTDDEEEEVDVELKDIAPVVLDQARVVNIAKLVHDHISKLSGTKDGYLNTGNLFWDTFGSDEKVLAKNITTLLTKLLANAPKTEALFAQITDVLLDNIIQALD